jgi:Xaa-Pro dipeptidase
MRINEYAPNTTKTKKLVESNVRRLNGLMETSGIDALFVITVDNWRYLTALPVHYSLAYANVNAAALVRGASLPVLLPLDFFASRIRVAAPWYSIARDLPFPGTPEALQPTGCGEWPKLIADTLSELGVANGVVAIDPGMPWAIQQQVQKLSPQMTLVDASNLLSTARLVKNEEEVASIRKACEIADLAIEAALAEARVGVAEFEIASIVESVFRHNGSEYPSMNPCVFSGDHPLLGYVCSTDRKLGEGELVRLDIGAVINGYCSCIARTGFLGVADEQLLRTYDLLRRVLRSGIEATRPGVTNSHVHETMDKTLREGSNGKYWLDWYGGHGIGLGLHEHPLIGQPGTVNEIVLQPGMVFALEPAILIEGKGWLGLEDNVVVTADGCDVLNHAPFELTTGKKRRY